MFDANRRVVAPLLPPSSTPLSALTSTTLSKQERRQQFEAQVKARDEMMQQQQAAAVAAEQIQPQLPDTTFYAAGSATVGFEDHHGLGYTESALGLSYSLDPGQSQVFTPEAGLASTFYSDQATYQGEFAHTCSDRLVAFFCAVVFWFFIWFPCWTWIQGCWPWSFKDTGSPSKMSRRPQVWNSARERVKCLMEED